MTILVALYNNIMLKQPFQFITVYNRPIQNGWPCKSDSNLTHDDSALNDLCCFRFVIIHIALRPTHCYKLINWKVLNIIFAVFLQTANSVSRYCKHTSSLVYSL